MESETLYTKGFNNGYLLAQYEPALLQTVLNNLRPETDYLDGLFSGKAEYELELQQRHEQELQQLRSKSQERGLERDL